MWRCSTCTNITIFTFCFKPLNFILGSNKPIMQNIWLILLFLIILSFLTKIETYIFSKLLIRSNNSFSLCVAPSSYIKQYFKPTLWKINNFRYTQAIHWLVVLALWTSKYYIQDLTEYFPKVITRHGHKTTIYYRVFIILVDAKSRYGQYGW